MSPSKPLPFVLNDTNFLQRLHAAIGRLVITSHAKLRMKERRITRKQIETCLQKGRVVEPAHLTSHGDWKATLEHCVAGDVINVAVALERQEGGDLAVVVTVIRGGS